MRPRELQVRDTASSAGDPPPHDLDSEIAVLSAAILEPGVVDEARHGPARGRFLLASQPADLVSDHLAGGRR